MQCKCLLQVGNTICAKCLQMFWSDITKRSLGNGFVMHVSKNSFLLLLLENWIGNTNWSSSQWKRTSKHKVPRKLWLSDILLRREQKNLICCWDFGNVHHETGNTTKMSWGKGNITAANKTNPAPKWTAFRRDASGNASDDALFRRRASTTDPAHWQTSLKKRHLHLL